MQVSISDLRVVTEKLFSHLETKGYSLVELSADYYWNILQEQQYDLYKEPNQFDLGQLTSDWTNLAEILEGTTEPIGYALVWLATILRAIGETVVE